MINKIKVPAIIFLSVVIFLWGSFATIKYFTHSRLPEVKIVGLENNGFYSGILNLNLKSENGYKISQISLLLDGKEIPSFSNPNKIGRKNFEIPLKLDTLSLSNGAHKIEVESIDSSYHKNKNHQTFDFNVDNIALKAELLSNEYKIEQGHTLHLKIQANKQLAKAQVKFLDKIYECTPESDLATLYECFIPIDCELNPADYMMSVDLQDHVGSNLNLVGKVTINPFNFIKQKGFSIAKGKLEEEKSVSMNNKILEEAIEKWVKDSPKKKMWSGPFEIPLDMKKIATPFGEIRMTQERGRYLHKAVDILNHPKCVVWASQDGKIIIKDRFLMSGNTIVIDHGLGVFTLYYHLEDFADLEVGDFIKKGKPIGRMGMTGYANGYHLHWEIRVNNMAVEPFEWTQKTF